MDDDGFQEQRSKRKKKSNSNSESNSIPSTSDFGNRRQSRNEISGLRSVKAEADITEWMGFVVDGKIENHIMDRLKRLSVDINGKICNLWDCIFEQFKNYLTQNEDIKDGFELKNYIYTIGNKGNKHNDHTALKNLSIKYKLQLRISSLVDDWNDIIYGTNLMRVIHLLHVGMNYFLPLISEGSDDSKYKLTEDNLKVLCNLNMIPSEKKASKFQIEKEKKHLKDILKLVRGKEMVEDVHLTPNNGKKKICYDISTPEQLNKMKNLIKCRLKLTNAHSGIAIPVELSENMKFKEIKLLSRRNCGYNAFQNDLVYVKINDKVTQTGKVMGVFESNHKPVNNIYICKVSRDQGSLMIPLDKFFPKIHVDNEPGRRNYEKIELKQLQRSSLAIEQKSVVDFERESSKYADNKYYSLFSMSMNRSMIKPQFTIDKVMSFDPVTCDKLFIVCYEYWDPYFMYPFGKIVGTLSTYDSFNDNFHLISSICSIEPYEADGTCTREVNEIIKKASSLSYVPGTYLPSDAVVFTIDNETTEDMDDAISYHRKEGKIVVGVHISDVTKYISQTHKLYEEAERRFCTSYPPKFSKLKPINILGDKLAGEVLSLVPGKPRAVMSVFFEFKETVVLSDCKEPPDFISKFNEGIIVSKYKLNYEQVSVWLKQSPGITEDLFIALNNIYMIARKIRRLRLPDSYFVRPINDYHKDFQINDQFEARILIEEFMILANENVAIKIYEKYPNCTLLRVQEPMENYEEWKNKLFQHTNMKFAAQLRDCCNLLKVSPNGEESKKCLIASRKFYDAFCEYIIDDINKARNLLQYDAFYNDFYLHITEWYIINKSARYQCSIKDSASNGHFSLNKQLYTHFSSPIRRFADVVVHRFLKSIINNYEIEFDSSDIDRVCEIANKKMKNNKMFDKICSTYAIFEEAGRKHCFILDCVCSEITDEELCFAHPLLEKATSVKKVKFADLSLDQVPLQRKGDNYIESCTLKWRKIIFSCLTIDDTVRSGKFIIDNHLFDCKLPSSEYQLFREIRRAYRSAESMEEQLSNLKSKFETHKDQIISSSKSIANPIIDIELELFIKNTMRIQFCKYKINGLQNIKPELYILTSTFQLCLIHQDNPEWYFIPGGKLQLKNNDVKKRFDSIKDYKEYFEPLIQIESLAETLGENSEFTLLSVDIKWLIGFSPITKRNEKYGVIVLPYKFCELKNINFNDEMIEFNDRIDYKIGKGKSSIGGDLLCLRCKPKKSETYWIGHGEVVHVGKWEKDKDRFKVIIFILTQSDYDISIDNSEDNKYTVDVYLRSVVSKRQQEAIASVHIHPLLKDVILGNQILSQNIDNKIIHNIREQIENKGVTKFNWNQSRAIENAMNNKISLIWGPPGTGKTHIGCIISSVYVYRNRVKQCNGVVLYCGPSNDCVNLVTFEMKKKFNEDCPKLLRIFGEQQEIADFPLPGRFTKNHVPLTGELQQDSLHYLIRKDNEELLTYDRYFQNILNPSNSNQLSENISEEILRSVLTYKEILKTAKIEFIKKNQFEMVLCTTSVTASRIMDNFNITQIIIDEAGMCKEPETLIPISLAESTVENVVLIGDHKQLRPIIKNQLAKKRGLEISLFERYQELKPDLVTMLNYQYRMHPSICEFPSKEFYRGKLKTQTSFLWSGLEYQDINCRYSDWNGIDYRAAFHYYQDKLRASNYNALPNEVWMKRRDPYICFDKIFDWYPERIYFVDVIGDETIQSVTTATGNENSRGNPAEVEAVGCIYAKIIKRLQPPRLAPSFITVLTQYKLQQYLIEKKCRNILSNMRIRTDPLVKTVIRSQGSENDYIIFSTVRSIRNPEDINDYPTPGWERTHLGFITDPNQINVALTRAKKGLIIIGNRRLLRVNYIWRKLILNFEERNCVITDYVNFLN